MARVFLGNKTLLDPVMNPVERIIYALVVFVPKDMTGWQYAQALLYLNLVMGIFVYLLIMFQGLLPLNPTGLCAYLALRVAHDDLISDQHRPATHYSSETTLSYLSQVAGLAF